MAHVRKCKVLSVVTIISLLVIGCFLVGCNESPSGVGLLPEGTATKLASSAISTALSVISTASSSVTPSVTPTATMTSSPTTSVWPSQMTLPIKPTSTATNTPVPSVTPTPTIQLIASSRDEVAPPNEMFAAVATPYANLLQLCLPENEESPMAWKWVIYEGIFACAIPGDNLPAKLSGRYGYWQPPAAEWLIFDFEHGQVMHFPEAENRGISFSRDGQYAVVGEGCYYEKCKKTVYRIDVGSKSSEEICKYKTFTVWYHGGCPPLPLRNGEMWDIKAEQNAQGCEYFRKRGWGEPEGC